MVRNKHADAPDSAVRRAAGDGRRTLTSGKPVIRRRDVIERGPQISPRAAPRRPHLSDSMIPTGDSHCLAPLDRVEQVREVP
jgi:hypothetical protein